MRVHLPGFLSRNSGLASPLVSAHVIAKQPQIPVLHKVFEFLALLDAEAPKPFSRSFLPSCFLFSMPAPSVLYGKPQRVRPAINGHFGALALCHAGALPFGSASDAGDANYFHNPSKRRPATRM